MSQGRFRCPACGFQIFNRRLSKCEACGNLLPSELLLTSEVAAKLDAEYERDRKKREKQRQKSRGSHESGVLSGGESCGSVDAGGFGDGGG